MHTSIDICVSLLALTSFLKLVHVFSLNSLEIDVHKWDLLQRKSCYLMEISSLYDNALLLKIESGSPPTDSRRLPRKRRAANKSNQDS